MVRTAITLPCIIERSWQRTENFLSPSPFKLFVWQKLSDTLSFPSTINSPIGYQQCSALLLPPSPLLHFFHYSLFRLHKIVGLRLQIKSSDQIQKDQLSVKWNVMIAYAAFHDSDSLRFVPFTEREHTIKVLKERGRRSGSPKHA